MKRKLLSMVLLVCMVISLLTGCGKSGAKSENKENASSNQTSGKETAKSADEKPYHAVMVYVVTGEAPDQELINERFNELTKKQLNMDVTLMPMTFSTWMSQLPLMLAGGEQVDLFPMFCSSAATYVASDYVADLSKYLDQYGPDLVKTVGMDDIKCCSINDFIWGIPTMKERSVPDAFCVRTDCLKKAGIDPSTIKSYEDMTAVFQKVKALYPNMIMFGGGSTATPAGQGVTFDGLGDSFGVLDNYGQTTTISNYYESDTFKNLSKLAREWYQAGYVSKDMPTCKDSGEILMKGGNLFSFLVNCKPNTKQEKDDQTGVDTTILQMDKDMVSTFTTSAVSYAVGSSSKDPAKAVELLNWISKTKEANDLLNWGIEGKHWEKQKDGTINYPSGVTVQNCGYHQNMGYILPNQFNSYVWSGTPTDIWDQYKKVRDEALVSKAYGFKPDLSEVADQLAALTQVQSKYVAQITTGSVDTDKAIDEFNKALYNAGLKDVMEAKQTQLNDWLSKNNK